MAGSSSEKAETAFDSSSRNATSISSVAEVPQWLRGCWTRAYIKQSFRPARKIDSDNIVRYVQGRRVCIDLRLLEGRGGDSVPKEEQMECFAGVTVVTPAVSKEDESASTSLPIVNWYPIFSFPPATVEDGPGVSERIARIAAGKEETEDRGTARLEERGNAWIEQDIETGGTELEELWEKAGVTSTAASALSASVNPGELDIDEWISEDACFVRVGTDFTCCWQKEVRSVFVFGTTGGACPVEDGIENTSPVMDSSAWKVTLSTDTQLEGRSLAEVFGT